jgi:5-methoxy-6-methylbenzimidazole methyltransferase
MDVKVALVFAAMEDPGFKPATVSNAEHLGLAYLAASLRARNIPVDIINGELEGLTAADVVERILESGARIVGYSPVSLAMKHTLRINAAVKARHPESVAILGGHLATTCAKEILDREPLIDMVVRGDAEESFPAVVETLARGDVPADVNGLTWRDRDGVAHENPNSRNLDLDHLAPPARDGLRFLKERGALSGARILASRGCHFNCSFCTTPVFYGRNVRFRSPQLVVQEMDELAAEFGISHFWFNDDLFVNGMPDNTRWIEEFCGLVTGRDYSFRVLCRADSFRDRNRHILPLLRDAGLVHVFLGLESGTQEGLSVYNKGTTVEKNRIAVEILKAEGIAVQIGFIMFNPYTTLDEVLESTRFLHRIGELFRFFPLTLAMSVFPGTSIAHRLKGDGLLDAVDYREPLACFRYQQPEMPGFVALMHSVYERYFALDAHILAAIGYDEGGRHDTVRRELGEINLSHVTEIVERMRIRTQRDAEEVIEPWMNSIESCLRKHGLEVRKLALRESVTAMAH